MRDVIASDWAKDRRARPLAVEITAHAGGGGIWSRPDIVSVEVRAFPYVPGKNLDSSPSRLSQQARSTPKRCLKSSRIAGEPHAPMSSSTFLQSTQRNSKVPSLKSPRWRVQTDRRSDRRRPRGLPNVNEREEAPRWSPIPSCSTASSRHTAQRADPGRDSRSPAIGRVSA